MTDSDDAERAGLAAIVAEPRGSLLLLRPGAEVVARVASLRPDGRGVLALAGGLVSAHLPAGVAEGDRLPLTVVGTEAGRILLRLRAEESPHGAGRRPAGEIDAYA